MATSAQRSTVLLVDDDRLIRLLVRRALEAVGCRVVEADTGEAGLVAAQVERPALILLDFHLPDLDAPQIVRRLRASPALAAIPILLLSAAQDAEELAEAFAAGVNDAIAKPVDGRALADRIRVELGRVH